MFALLWVVAGLCFAALPLLSALERFATRRWKASWRAENAAAIAELESIMADRAKRNRILSFAYSNHIELRALIAQYRATGSL